jgi:hypothetical protein
MCDDGVAEIVPAEGVPAQDGLPMAYDLKASVKGILELVEA